LTAPPQCVQVSMSILNTRFSRCAACNENPAAFATELLSSRAGECGESSCTSRLVGEKEWALQATSRTKAECVTLAESDAHDGAGFLRNGSETPSLQILPPGASPPDDIAVRLLATGRGSLSVILGDEQRRAALFAGRVCWHRVWLAQIDGTTVGFLAFQTRGRGPYAVRLQDFARTFGSRGGLWRWALNGLLDLRSAWPGYYIYGLKVEPAARRRGVARALVAAALAQAATLGVRQVELEVFDHNERALAFYAALGFEPVRRRQMGRLSAWLGFAAVVRLRRHTATRA